MLQTPLAFAIPPLQTLPPHLQSPWRDETYLKSQFHSINNKPPPVSLTQLMFVAPEAPAGSKPNFTQLMFVVPEVLLLLQTGGF